MDFLYEIGGVARSGTEVRVPFHTAEGDTAFVVEGLKVTGKLAVYGNQQYLVRNSSIGGSTGCPNGLWNMVYAGVKGALEHGLGPAQD